MQQVLANDYFGILQKCQEVAGFIEMGQAQTPLLDLFQQLERDIEQKPLAITLLCLTPNSRTAALKWLYGHNFAFFSVEVSNQIGLLELHLKERGFSLEKSTGERLDFNRWDELVGAIVDAKILSPTNKSALKLGTEAATGIKNLHVLMPESTAFVEESPALLTRLVRESNFLVVSAPLGYQLSEVDRRVINNLMEDMAGLWPLPVMEAGEQMGINQWWMEFKPQVSIPLMLLTDPISGTLPEYLTNNAHPFRKALQFSLFSQKQQSACGALVDRYQQELQKLQARQKREERSSTETPRSTDSTGQSVLQLRTQLDDTIADIKQSVETANRKNELPTATGIASLKQHIDSFTSDDLKQEPAHKVIKLSLDERYLRNITGTIGQLTSQTVKDELAELHKKMDGLAKQISLQASQILGFPINLSHTHIDEKALLKDLQELINVDLRYQGEMPKRGLIDRLSEGRKSVFMILMTVSLLGAMMGGSSALRNSKWMGFILLPVFIGSIIYTFYSWKQEDAHRFDKELSKVKDELLSSSRRLISEINRLKLQYITQHLERFKKQWVQQLEQTLREQQQRNQQQSEQEKSKAKARLQGLAAQLREWEAYRFNVQKLTSDAEHFARKASEFMKSAAK